MVKIVDGTLALGSQLLGGAAEDDEGRALKFQSVEGAIIPTYSTRMNTTDGSGIVKIYTFSLEDTPIRVSVIRKTAEEIKAEEEQAVTAAKKEADEAAAQRRSKALQETQQTFTKTEKAFKTVSAANKPNKK